MDLLLCDEEISWSPCFHSTPLSPYDSDFAHMSSISSPPLISTNSSIDCSSIECSISCNSTNHQCSSYCSIDSSINCNSTVHQCSPNCNTDNLSNFSPSLASSSSSASASAFVSSYMPSIDEHELDHLLEKQLDYMPEKHYLAGLQLNNLCQARSTAIQWLVEAQSNFNFTSTTIALAINYFDRYLAINVSKVWTSWMLELLSTACLSTAAKMEEVSVPQLLDLQVGARKHTFDSSTVQRMELLLLNTLQWKMRSITPFSFVELALCGFDIEPHLKNILFVRISELLFGAFLETNSLEFCPSILATTSIYCALEDIAPPLIDQFESVNHLAKEVLHNNEDGFLRCHKLMEVEVVDPMTQLRTYSSSDDDVTNMITIIDGPLVAQTKTSYQSCELTASFLFEPHFSSHNIDNKSYLYLCAVSTSSKKRKRAQETK